MSKTLGRFFGGNPPVNVTEFQSSATWQNPPIIISFPKNPRFKKKNVMNDLMYSIPSTRTKRDCTFGYGNKVIQTLARRLNDKHNPPPDRYNIKDFTKINKTHNKGKTFGITHDKYERVYTKNKMRP